MLKLTVKTLQQKSFSIEVADNATILSVKELIENQEGFIAASQILIFQGKILDDSATIATCNIKEKDFIVMMIKKKITQPQSPSSSSKSTAEEFKKPEEIKPSPIARQEITTPSIPIVNEATPISEDQEMAILTLMEMGGFDRDLVIKALKAAYNNPDRAAEYLFSGKIPDDLGQDSFSPSGSNGLQALSFLKTDPQFQQLKALLNQQPNLLQPLLQQIGSVNPRLLQLINENQSEFLALLEDGKEDGNESHDNSTSDQDELHDGTIDGDIYDEVEEGGDNDYEKSRDQNTTGNSATAIPHTQYIQVTSQEKEAIDRLVNLGFPRDRAIEAYFACDKDESLAANYLFDNPPEDAAFPENQNSAS